MVNISFGERLRRACVRNGMTQHDLGLKVGVSAPTISNWETGKTQLSPQQKKQLKLILGGWTSEESADKGEALAEVGPTAVSAWLARTRQQKNMTIPELAIAANLSTAALYNIESGKIANPRSETLRRLEKALGSEIPTEARDEIREEATIEGVGELVDFDPHDDEDLPATPGIYVLYDISERPIYVGQGTDIKSRIRSHRDKFWFKSPIVQTAAYVKVEDKGLREKMESLFIRFLRSNAVINKQGVGR